MIQCDGVDFTKLPNGEFDSPLGPASGAGDIFGATGGVMEATLRTACEIMTGGRDCRLEFNEVRAVNGLREIQVTFGDRTLEVGVANGLVNAKTLLDKVLNREKLFHVIEVMACPGGCVGGGGQPYPPPGFRFLDPRLNSLRAQALYAIDGTKQIRRSHKNPAVISLYSEFLGNPGGEKATALLHTDYTPEIPQGDQMNTCADCKRDVIAESKEALGPEIVEYVKMCNGLFQPHSMLIAVLHKIQDRYGWLSSEHLDAVAQLMQIPTAKVSGVATFYNFFQLKPRGRFIIRVCMGTACFVKGADRLIEKFRQELGIDSGETTGDGLFTLEETRCLGTCALAPVMMIGDNIHPHFTPDAVPGLIRKYAGIARSESVKMSFPERGLSDNER